MLAVAASRLRRLLLGVPFVGRRLSAALMCPPPSVARIVGTPTRRRALRGEGSVFRCRVIEAQIAGPGAGERNCDRRVLRGAGRRGPGDWTGLWCGAGGAAEITSPQRYA